MSGDQPFTPVILATVGKSLTIDVSITNAGLVTSTTSAMAQTLLVTNASNVTLFVRMSTEAIPVATSLDVPISPGASRLFGNPAPAGVTGIGVVASITGGTASGFAVFTPGNSGIE